jgi:sugar/nucleoside kinase (ribokinase family)
MKSSYDVLGIGAPIVDYIVHVGEEFLHNNQIEKGGMVLVDEPTFTRLLEKTSLTPIRTAGGSAANTIKGLTKLNNRCGFVGKIGKDEPGHFFRDHFVSSQIHPHLIPSSYHTAKALTLITPDGQRTFRTFIGAGMQLTGDDIKEEFCHKTRLVHLEGYLLNNGDLVERAMEMSKAAGAKISLDLASFEIVTQFRERLIRLIPSYVDVLFANDQETTALTGKGPEESVEIVRDMCETVVLFEGPEGCWVGQGIKKVHCPAFPVKPVDTIGAGDLFGSGFLHGYLQGLPVEECARYGALTGRAVVSGVGADITEKEWERVFREM